MTQSVWKRLMSVCTAAVLGVGLMVPAVSAGAQEDGSRLWDFRDGEQGWGYDDSWKGSAEVTGNVSHDAEKEMLKVDIDFTAEKDNGWCQSGISFSEESGIDYSEFNTLTFDLYYDAAAYTTGQITVKAASDNVFQEQMEGISSAVTEDIESSGRIRKHDIRTHGGYSAQSGNFFSQLVRHTGYDRIYLGNRGPGLRKSV